ncbi:MAG: M56 family metallopeptidase [Aeoliella sp.]
MNAQYDYWLTGFADYYLLATLLMTVVVAAPFVVHQPARRLAIAWSTVGALLILAALVALPGWSVVHLLDAPPSRPTSVAPIQAVTITAETASKPRTGIMELLPSDPVEANTQPTSNATPITVIAPAETAIRDMNIGPYLLLSLATGSAAMLVWLVLGAWQTGRLVRNSSPAPAELMSLLKALAAGNASHPDLRLSSQMATGVALGLWRPTILLPQSYAEIQDVPSLQSVLSHEMAHLRNGDLWLLAALRLLMIALWAHPLYWLVRRRFRLDQETLADAAAAESSSRESYAEQLVGWARELNTARPPAFAGAVGLWENRSQLRQRIAVLLDERLTVLSDCSRQWKLSVVALCVMAAVGLSMVTMEPEKSLAEEGGANTQAAGTSSAENSTAESVQMKSLKVRVVDELGEPVVSAKLIPKALRALNDGSWYSWESGMPSVRPDPVEAITDADGYTILKYPQFTEERRPTSVVIVAASHDEFVDDNTELAIVAAQPQVLMKRGGRIEVTAMAPDNSKPTDRLFALTGYAAEPAWSGAGSGKLRSPLLEKTAHTLRVVHLPAQGPAFFSLPIPVTPQVGKTKDLEVQLLLGTKLLGKLDETVPRPVFGGHVIARVASGGTVWTDWTNIGEDGTFVFESLPRDPGEVVQLVGICEGFVSSPRGGYDEDEPQSTPQTTNLGGDEVEHTLEMMATAKCIIRCRDGKGRPVAGALVDFWPNTKWLSGGSGLVAWPKLSSREQLLTNKPHRWSDVDKDYPYRATTNEEGVATLLNLPPFGPLNFAVSHDEFQLPLTGDTRRTREGTVELRPNVFSEVDVALQPKGKDFITGSEAQSKTEQPSQDVITFIPSPPKDYYIVIAKHMMLLDGKEFITWPDIEDRIGAQKDSSKVHLHYYITRGAREEGQEEYFRIRHRELEKKFGFSGYSIGSLWPRADYRYDKLETVVDLIPNPQHAVTGRVVHANGQSVANAQVLMIEPVDESIQYKAYHSALVNGKVRNRLEHVITDSNAEGNFTIYPTTDDGKYFVIAIHPEKGIGIRRHSDRKEGISLVLTPWANVSGIISPSDEYEQSVSLSTRIAAKDGWPELRFNQYGEDIKNDSHNGRYRFRTVPASFPTQLQRSVKGERGTSYSSPVRDFQLEPGEDRREDIAPMTAEAQERIESTRRRMEEVRRSRTNAD